MTNSIIDETVAKIAKIKNISTDKAKQMIRDKAITLVIKELNDKGKTPFDIGEDRFEVLVANAEKDFISELKNKSLKGLGVVALLLGIG